jgi:hypothetical protein
MLLPLNPPFPDENFAANVIIWAMFFFFIEVAMNANWG